MKIGFIGLGKLGAPIAACLAQAHDVVGYDLNEEWMDRARSLPEAGDTRNGLSMESLCHKATWLAAESIQQLCDEAPKAVFVCVQTPHDEMYEGITPLPSTRRDFDYSYLTACIEELALHIPPHVPVVVISTVLPGTMRREVIPLLPHNPLVYSPSFCAMGTVVDDWLRPEGILVGLDVHPEIDDIDLEQASLLLDIMSLAGVNASNGIKAMSIESAELAKVAYNTFISTKLAVINVLGELCDRVPYADIDEVSEWLEAANRRVASPAYMRAGMGDGGACHPRDNIAMSWLARKLGLHYDIFEASMLARQNHAIWLARELWVLSREARMPVAIVGINYKPGSPLRDGSHAMLVASVLDMMAQDDEEKVKAGVIQEEDAVKIAGVGATGQVSYEAFQAMVDATDPMIYLIGQPEAWMQSVEWKPGSIILDPWRIVRDQLDVRVISLGSRWRGA